jgi:hypothetical protein
VTRHARADAHGARRWVGALVVGLLLTVAAALAPLVTPSSGAGVAAAEGPSAASSGVPSAIAATPTPTPTPDPNAEFTIMAAGDVLPHLPVLSSARTAGGGYDFSPVLAGLDPWVQGADLALCHFEVPVASPGTAPSGYPMFATPAEIAAALRTQGWDGCSTASNHSVDRGFKGVTATLDALDAAGLGHVGTARSAIEQGQPQLCTLERPGQQITVAHIAAAYGTNGMPIDADKPWSVNLIDVPALVT